MGTKLDSQRNLTLEESNLTFKLNNDLLGYSVNLIENPEGYKKGIIYDGEKIYLVHGKDREEDNRIIALFNKKYIKKFKKFIKYFEKIPFNMYSKVIKDKIYFYDMNINSNWVYKDTLDTILLKCSLSPLPTIYTGPYSEDVIKNKIDRNSIITNDKLKSVYVRSVIESEVNKKRINFYVDEKSFLPILDKSKKNDVRTEVESLINKKVSLNSDYLKNQWVSMLNIKGLNLNSKKSDIYRTIVYRSIDNWYFELSKISNDLKVDKKDVDKIVKGILPKFVRKILL